MTKTTEIPSLQVIDLAKMPSLTRIFRKKIIPLQDLICPIPHKACEIFLAAARENGAIIINGAPNPDNHAHILVDLRKMPSLVEMFPQAEITSHELSKLFPSSYVSSYVWPLISKAASDHYCYLGTYKKD